MGLREEEVKKTYAKKLETVKSSTFNFKDEQNKSLLTTKIVQGCINGLISFSEL